MKYEIGQVRAQAWGLNGDYDELRADERTEQYWECERERIEQSLGFPVRLERHSREIDDRGFIDRRVIVRA